MARPRSDVLVKAGRSERALRLLELLHPKGSLTHTPLLTPLAYRRCRPFGSTITLSSKLWPSIGYWTCGGAFGCCFLQNRGLSKLTGTCQLDLRCLFKRNPRQNKRNPRQNFAYFKAPTICMGPAILESPFSRHVTTDTACRFVIACTCLKQEKPTRWGNETQSQFICLKDASEITEQCNPDVKWVNRVSRNA